MRGNSSHAIARSHMPTTIHNWSARGRDTGSSTPPPDRIGSRDSHRSLSRGATRVTTCAS